MTIQDEISKVRGAIDAIDAEIAHLLAKRTAIAQTVALSKKIDAENANTELSFGWRPKREIEVLRQLRIAEPSLDYKLCYMIWRAMITRNLASQAPMEVIAIKETDAAARIGFGAAISPKIIENADEAIKLAAQNDNIILTLPFPDENSVWWIEAAKPENSELKINMALPHYHDSLAPEALSLAKITPTQTGKDKSLVITQSRDLPKDNAKLLSKFGDKHLWLLDGFHDDIGYFLGAFAIV